MASHTKEDDNCLECQWETFRLDGKESENYSEIDPEKQWHCTGEEDHTSAPHCDLEDACCDLDDCSVGCASVCDGFVDCDESVACSAPHCDDGCDDDCGDTDCKSVDPLCFEDHCFGDGTADCAENSLDSLLALGGPLNLESNDFIPTCTMEQTQMNHMSKTSGLPASSVIGPEPSTEELFAPYPTVATHSHPQTFNHLHCHDFPKELHNDLMNPTFPAQNDVNPADIFHVLGMCPDLSSSHPFFVHEDQNCHDHSKLNNDTSATSPSCFHIPHYSMNEVMKNPNYISGHGPCRSHHRCRGHAHAHVHPYASYSPYTRHSRSSISSHLMSSPGETPPPLEGGASSSVLTTPEYTPTDHELHTCKWTTMSHGMKVTCGATFPDSCTLQEHLIARHMTTVDGAKGTGYYCCWEGCHRPDEPFSQKSKLQGHFLTHSNYKNFKCSVCGKFFARQATLERHERSHRGEKPYKCSECGKSFTDSSELKTHSRTHTGEKPFRCTYPGCNFQTGDSSNMSSHRLTHGERRHRCAFPGCTKSFTRPDQLKRHIKSTHKNAPLAFPSPTMADEFTIPFGTVV
ncbi:zinc-finger protein [Aspergillus nanangensis]|uniref:Zinc-finger protein n=1 Tax=Aspergillus nanangensis TaxID=2582783 RepID=A0AAD4CJ49_ASPNN|nr:zinc-finger protein [Aspergillus nanangensis]